MKATLPQPLLHEIKAARESKGLTQRALGDRVGLPQSHISRIESGAVDVQVSSLVAIARALDLELMLIRRPLLSAVGAVQAVGRGRRPGFPLEEHARSLRDIKRLASAQSQRMRADVPALPQLIRIATDLQHAEGLLTDPVLDELTSTINEVLGQLKKLESTKLTRAAHQSLLEALASSTARLAKQRDALAHSVADGSASSQPAYRLDDDGGSDG